MNSFLSFLPALHGIWFVSLQTVLMAGLLLERNREKRICALPEPLPAGDGGAASRPLVSVVIPVRNEEGRIKPLLESLLAQDYPAEYVFVDDRSTDGSPALLADFTDKARAAGFSVTLLTFAENPGPNHKQYALGKGIDAARGEFFLFTDADCEVPPGWVRAMAQRMADPAVGAVISPVFKKKGGRGFFYSYQCYDHVVRFIYLAGAAGLGAAGGGFGNNLILRRGALEAAGGYAAVPPSPTEDAALISLIRSKTSYKTRAASGGGTHVTTGSETSWRAFIAQTLRWNNGGLFSPELVTRINYNLLMITICLGILAIPLLPFFPRLWPMPFGVFIVMLENTAGALLVAAKNRRPGARASSLPKAAFAWIPELLFTPVYFTLMTLMGYFGIRPRWKE